jgi:2-succinyl-5-enolpyruvyl-6-hydroxy-3-cyclohexene-1-carboxylate synthase
MLANPDSPLIEWECVIHIGGPFVSKRLQQALENNPPDHYWRVEPNPNRHDPGHQLTHRFDCSAISFKNTMREFSSNQNHGWNKMCQESSTSIAETLKKEFSSNEIAEPGAIRRIIQHCPGQSVLVLGSSMPIRDADIYGTSQATGLEVTANRGASGIDGTIATTVGYANVRNAAVTLILGDLTALHDLNSLALTKNLNTPFVIVVINNRGGGIFSLLPIAEHEENFEPFWGTPHPFDFQKFAEGFGLEYAIPQSLAELEDVYGIAIVSSKCTLIEVQTSRDENRLIHENLLGKFLS